jgi:hypothetical protein
MSTMNNLGYEQRMLAAIESLKSQEPHDFSRTAKEFNLGRTALARRFKGETTSRAEANSASRQALTSDEEEVLIERINYLTNRNLSPTPSVVKNLAQEIRKAEVGKNWVQ